MRPFNDPNLRSLAQTDKKLDEFVKLEVARLLEFTTPSIQIIKGCVVGVHSVKILGLYQFP